MKKMPRKFANKILRYFDRAIIPRSTLQDLRVSKHSSLDIEFLATLPDEHIAYFLKNIDKSRAQRRQDIFVLSELGLKKNGFFVEIGASNGLDLSNTYMLEKEFGWRGILSEPGRCWHLALKRNRSCIIDTHCVWSESNALLKFNETKNPCFSTISRFSDGDHHAARRKNGRIYEVEAIALLDLLAVHDAPTEIDYLSIDTEGSEYEILREFDFDRYSFGVITCEHNHTPMREKIYDLLVSKGYQRKFEEISDRDDWYVKQ